MLVRVNSVATVGLDAQFLEDELGGDDGGAVGLGDGVSQTVLRLEAFLRRYALDVQRY